MDLASQWSKIPRGTSTDATFLTWQARCMLSELWRKADRHGLLDLGRRGLAGVTGVIGAPPGDWPHIKPFLDELMESGFVEYTAGDGVNLLSVRGCEEYQGGESPSSSAERMRRLRKRRDRSDRCDVTSDACDGSDASPTVTASQRDEKRIEEKRSEEKRSPKPPQGAGNGVTAEQCWQAIAEGAGAALMYTAQVKAKAPPGGFLPGVQQSFFATAAAEALRAGEGLASFKRLGEYIRAGALHWQHGRAPWDHVARELASMLSAAEFWERSGKPDPKNRNRAPPAAGVRDDHDRKTEDEARRKATERLLSEDP